MTTFVTSFTANVNNRNDRKLEDYLEHGKMLLKQPYNKVIFMEPDLIAPLEEYCRQFPEVKNFFVPYRFDEIWLCPIRDKFPNHNIVGNVGKDTQDYFMIMNNKPELLKIAIEMNLYDTEDFVWIDFGIYHIFKGNEKLFEESLKSLLNKQSLIRAGSCWHPNKFYQEIISLNTVQWYFAGGIIGGNRKNILTFAELCRNKLLEIINKFHTITWEVNVWYEVYKYNPHLFSMYECDHNHTLIAYY
jgi:hypothetical protein